MVPDTTSVCAPYYRTKIYIAGPMRGIPEFNFPTFDRARDELTALGYEAVSPADLDRANGFEGLGKNGKPDEVEMPIVKVMLRRDIEALSNCDGIALLPGWEHSTGVALELAYAHACDMPVYLINDDYTLTTYHGSGKPISSDEGTKHDIGKARYDLLSPDALDGLVAVLTFGANKYSDRNWEKGIKYSRVFAAAMRHLWAWWAQENEDVETGLSHLDHAACCIHFLSTYVKRDMTQFDDRA